MRRLSAAELGGFRGDLLHLIARSPDPFASLLYMIDLGPCKKMIANICADTGCKISLTAALNKLFAHAIAENPVLNQVVLGRHIYQIEGVHISNAVLLTNADERITYVIIDNPHQKPLQIIQDEFARARRELEKSHAERSRNNAAAAIMRFFYRFELYRLLGEKRAFKMGFERGMISNIVLSNQYYGRPATFFVLKPIITSMKVALRIHAHGTIPPILNGSQTCEHDIVPFNISIDHRVLHGIHAHRFGESLERIAADPETYLM